MYTIENVKSKYGYAIFPYRNANDRAYLIYRCRKEFIFNFMYWALLWCKGVLYTYICQLVIKKSGKSPLQKNTIQIPFNGPRGYNGQWYLNGIWMVSECFF